MLETMFRTAPPPLPAPPALNDNGRVVIDRVAHFQVKQQEAVLRLPQKLRQAPGEQILLLFRALHQGRMAIEIAIADGQYDDAVTALDELRRCEMADAERAHPLVRHAFAEQRDEIVRKLYGQICDAAEQAYARGDQFEKALQARADSGTLLHTLP